MFKRKWLYFLLVLILAGCQNKPASGKKTESITAATVPPAATIVAKVGDFYVTSDDLKREVENYNALLTAQGMGKNKIDSRDKKITFLKDDIVRRYILYKEALSRGLDKKPEVLKALEDTRMSLLVTELLREEIEKIEVTSKEIEDFYSQNKDILKEPEQRKILEIATPTEEEAKQVYIELLKGTDFSTLARQYSKAESAASGGDAGFLANEIDPKKRLRFDKFYEIAFSPSLETGQISNIFKGPDSYYIVKLAEVKKTEAKPLNELWDNIKTYLLFVKQQKAIADLSNKLSSDTKIEIYEGKIEQ